MGDRYGAVNSSKRSASYEKRGNDCCKNYDKPIKMNVMPANKEHAGKTGTNRARTREIVRFRVTRDFKSDFSFVLARDTSRGDRIRDTCLELNILAAYEAKTKWSQSLAFNRQCVSRETVLPRISILVVNVA